MPTYDELIFSYTDIDDFFLILFLFKNLNIAKNKINESAFFILFFIQKSKYS